MNSEIPFFVKHLPQQSSADWKLDFLIKYLFVQSCFLHRNIIILYKVESQCLVLKTICSLFQDTLDSFLETSWNRKVHWEQM